MNEYEFDIINGRTKCPRCKSNLFLKETEVVCSQCDYETVREGVVEMSDEIVASDIIELIDQALRFHDDVEGNDIAFIRTFNKAKVLPGGQGLVLEMVNGSEFQVTIVQSK